MSNDDLKSPRPGVCLLQYNTHLFHNSAAVRASEAREELNRLIGKQGSKDQIVYLDEQRRDAIAKKIAELDPPPDIIALNEVWAENDMKWFADHFKNLYPNSIFVGSEEKIPLTKFIPQLIKKYPALVGIVVLVRGLVVFSIPIATAAGIAWACLGKRKREALKKIVQFGQNFCKANSGLVLLSKFIILKSSFHPFPRLDPVQALLDNVEHVEEQLCNKGSIVAVLETPSGKRFVFCMTHTGGIDDIQPLVNHIKSTIPQDMKESPIIITGDLNVHASLPMGGEDPTQGKKMERLFGTLNAVDVWNEIHPSEPGNTVNKPKNRLFQYFFPLKKDERFDPTSIWQVDRIDYAYYFKGSSPEQMLQPTSAIVIENWILPTPTDGDMDLSDHYPLEVLFNL